MRNIILLTRLYNTVMIVLNLISALLFSAMLVVGITGDSDTTLGLHIFLGILVFVNIATIVFHGAAFYYAPIPGKLAYWLNWISFILGCVSILSIIPGLIMIIIFRTKKVKSYYLVS